jgi:hypothetical protein
MAERASPSLSALFASILRVGFSGRSAAHVSNADSSHLADAVDPGARHNNQMPHSSQQHN